MAIEVTIELTGPAQLSARRQDVSIAVEEGATWRDVIAALAWEVPVLVGTAIAEDRRDLIWPYLLNLGGRKAIANLDEKAQLKEGDRLSLLMEPC